MKYNASTQKSVFQSAPVANPNTATGSQGIALTPPTYGMGVIDSQIRQAGTDQAAPSLIIQPKLRLGPVGDHYEQEADHVAAQVVNGSRVPITSGNSLLPQLQRVASTPTAGSTISPNIESGIAAARGGGQPLPTSVRSQMERSFGANFSNVRIHTDGRANQLNQAIQAKAFTTGRDVFFGRGEYQPGGGAGRGLLAHELAHVVQQGATGAVVVQRAMLRNQRYWMGKKLGISIGKAGREGLAARGQAHAPNPQMSAADQRKADLEHYQERLEGLFNYLRHNMAEAKGNPQQIASILEAIRETQATIGEVTGVLLADYPDNIVIPKTFQRH